MLSNPKLFAELIEVSVHNYGKSGTAGNDPYLVNSVKRPKKIDCPLE